MTENNYQLLYFLPFEIIPEEVEIINAMTQ